MLLAILATIYLIVAFAIVLTVDRIAGVMFRVPDEAAPSLLRLTPVRFLRKSSRQI